MKNSNLLSEIKNLSRTEKLKIMLYLITELTQKEDIVNSYESDVYLAQLRNSPEAAHQLRKLLEQEKQLQKV